MDSAQLTTIKIGLSICLISGVSFGVWQESWMAGLFATMMTAAVIGNWRL